MWLGCIRRLIHLVKNETQVALSWHGISPYKAEIRFDWREKP